MADWQRTPLRDWSRLDADGRFVHRRGGMSVPRQAGKSHDGIIWAAFLASQLHYHALWTDHNYATTCEMLDRFRKIFGRKPGDPNAPRAMNRLVEGSKSKTAQECFEFEGGGVLAFSTRTDSSSLGMSFDVIIYDEAQLLTSAQVQTLEPTKSHAPHKNSQSIFLGTPTRAGCTANVFRELRAEAWSDSPGDDLCWLEYGVDEVGDPFDESRWTLANPTLAEGLVEAEDIRTGALVMRTDPLGVAQEYLGYWLPADRTAGPPPLLEEGEWAALAVDSAPEPTPGERVAYGVRFAADGATVAVAAACRTPGRDAAHVELVFNERAERGVEWLASWLAERSGRAACVCVDGKAGAGALMDALEARRAPKGYAVRATTDQAVQAAALTLEAVRSRALTHVADDVLDASAETSHRRAIGKDGAWGWGGDSAPVEAVGLALLALKSKRDPKRRQVVW